MVKVCKPDCEGTIAGTRGNGEDAPFPAVRRVGRNRQGTVHVF